MDTFFELLDVESGNVLESFDTEGEALASLRAVLVERGEQAIEGLALLRFDNDRPTLIAMEDELVAHIQAMVGGGRIPGVAGLRSSA